MRVAISALLLVLLTVALAPSATAAEAPFVLTRDGCQDDLVRYVVGDVASPCMTEEQANAPDVIKFYPCFRPGTFYAVILGKIYTGCIG